MKKKEADEQISLMNWAKYQMGKYPELRMLHHVPNGGYRNQIEARNLKLQGVKAGVPDLVLPVARGGYFGLYIELKADKNCKTSKNQELWIDDLRKEGYHAGVCYGFEDAVRVIEKYLSLPKTTVL